MVDRQLHVSIRETKRLLVEMGSYVEKAIQQAVQSLAMQNVPLAEWVIQEDQKIDELEDSIARSVTQLVATQQPVAKDLRKLIAVMRIASDLERMADLAVNIANVTIDFERKQLSLFKELEDITKMAKITEQMVRDVIQSYLDGDLELATNLAELDDQVDRLYQQVFDEITQFLKDHHEHAETILHLALVARYLERIADHATNIAENIHFIETGDQTNLN